MNTSSTDRPWTWLRRSFHSTRWTLVRRLRPGETSRPSPSEEEFCRCYWFPLYSFLRHQGYGEEDARDHVQSFFAGLLTGPVLGQADPGRGRFRNYLLTLLERHVATRRRHATAQKRGGGAWHVPLEQAEAAYLGSRGLAGSPEEAFRRVFAGRLVAEGLRALEEWYAARNKQAVFAELLPALEGPLPDTTYAEVGARLGMSAGAVAMAVRQLRERFKEAVTAAASRLLGLPRGAALDAELAGLFAGPENSSIS